MEAYKTLYSIPIGSLTFEITVDLVIQWIVIVILATLGIISTRKLKKVPDKKQTVVEMIYNVVDSVVTENMGEEYKAFIPFIGTLAVYLLCLNLVGLFGIKPPTQDYSVALGFALTTFVLVQATAIRKVGLLHYFGGYFKPFIPMFPLNLMERVMLPVSLSLRLFGNILAATVLVDLVYEALHNISWFAQLGIPVFLHAYFDLFDGVIQMVIFVMLTMINIKITAEH